MPKTAAKKKTGKKQVKSVKRAKKASLKPNKAKMSSKPKIKANKAEKPAKKQQKYEPTSIYEETTITCPGCGRITKVIKLAGVDTEGMICQRCAKGEVELGDMDF